MKSKSQIHAIILTILSFSFIVIQGCHKEPLPCNVITTSVTDITDHSITCTYEVNSYDDVASHGVCWAEGDNHAYSSLSHCDGSIRDGNGEGTFSVHIPNLTSGTDYSIRAYATNSDGFYVPGNIITFTTKGKPDWVYLNKIQNITTSSATVKCNVQKDFGSPITARGVCWSSTNSNPTIANSHTTSTGGVGEFTNSISGLSQGTKYYVRAYATNEYGTTYSSTMSFTTSKPDLTITVNGVSFTMVYVAAGSFRLDDDYSYYTELSSYYIGETEVEQQLWKAVMGSNPSDYYGDRKPVEGVTWNDCQTFITKLNSLTGRKFALPTEAQWEYAAKGGNNSLGYRYSGSDNINVVAWYNDNSTATHNTKEKAPNELGIYDMSGNVQEWCQDWYGSYVANSCPIPSNLAALPGMDAAEMSWTNGGGEAEWIIHVWNTIFDQTFPVTTNPVNVTGLAPGWAYHAAIAATCGELLSEYSDTITFTTDECDPVTNVSVAVDGTIATVTWNAGENNDSTFLVEYGYDGFATGHGWSTITTTNSVTLTGLDYETSYEVYVRAICDGQYYSIWGNGCRFTTECCSNVYDIREDFITENSAQISWSSEAGNHEVKYGKEGVPLSGYTLIPVFGTTVTLTNLEADTRYNIYVRAECSDFCYRDWSDWSNPLTITTDVGVFENVNATENGRVTNLYPNPAENSSTIEMRGIVGDVIITIVDIDGHIVNCYTEECNGECEYTIDVNNLAKGCYFVRLQGNGIDIVKKLIITE